MNDWELIQQYVQQGSESAFAELVKRYIDLVHAAGIRQTGDRELAEEVAQAVFLLLARKAGSFRRSVILPAWLLHTTRFVAARAFRGEQRRQRREQQAFAMDQLSSSGQDWPQIAPVLDEALARLNGTDRNALVLRFFQDKPLQEVGTALGISEAAAKKRVSRALDRLRAVLDRRGVKVSAGTLAAAFAGNVLEAAPSSLTARITAAEAACRLGTAQAPALVQATLSAWRRIKLGWAAGLAVTSASLMLLLTWALAPGPLPSDLQPIVSDVAAQSTAPAQPETAALSATEPEPLARHVDFRAVDAETGAGVAGARITVMLWQNWNVDLRDGLTTDADGRCRVPLPDAELGRLDIGVLAPSYVQTFVTFRQDVFWPIPPSYEMRLLPGVRIGGWVRDESGSAVLGADILVRIPGAGDSSSREPKAERNGFPGNLTVAKTDPDGRWFFASLPPELEDFSVEVKHPDFCWANFVSSSDERRYVTPPPRFALAEARAEAAVFVLQRGLTFTGSVMDESGAPVPGAKVDPGSFLSSVETDADGGFSLRNLPPGPRQFTISAQGFAPERLSTEMKPDLSPVTVQLRRGARLKLLAVDQGGSAVAGARIQLEEWRGDRNALEWGGFTDATGRIEWDSAPYDELRVCALKPAFVSSRENRVRAGEEEQVITLRRQVQISGLVIDAGTKQVIPAFKAIPGYGSDRPNWYRGSVKQGKNGLYTVDFDEWHPPFAVRVEADGYEPAESGPVHLDEFGAGTCNFELKPLDPRSAVSGVVLLPDGSPASGAEVALCTLDKGMRLGRARFNSRNESQVTDADDEGCFWFPPASRAHTVVAVHQSGFARVRLREQRQDLAIQLQPWGRVEGVVHDVRALEARHEVILTDDASANFRGSVVLDFEMFSARPNERGEFVIEQVPPGEFTLYVNPGVGNPFTHRTAVDVTPGATVQVQVGGQGRRVVGRFLATTPGLISDWAKRKSMVSLSSEPRMATPPEGVSGDALELWRVDYWQSPEGRAHLRNTHHIQLQVSSDGTFSCDDVPPGTYNLRAHFAVDADKVAAAQVSWLTVDRRDVVVPPQTEPGPADPLDLGVVQAAPQNRARASLPPK